MCIGYGNVADTFFLCSASDRSSESRSTLARSLTIAHEPSPVLEMDFYMSPPLAIAPILAAIMNWSRRRGAQEKPECAVRLGGFVGRAQNRSLTDVFHCNLQHHLS